MKSKIVILANSPVRIGNRGCAALSYMSIILIDQIMSDKDIPYELYLTDHYQQIGARQKISINEKEIWYQCISYPFTFSLIDMFKILSKPKEMVKSWILFFKADYFLDIGQGDSFADIYGKQRFYMIDNVHSLARFFNKSYCLLPQTIGPFNNMSIRKKAVRSIVKASIVMARDEQSLNYVKEIAPGLKNIGHYIDVAFFLPYKKESFDISYIHVGLNVSALLWHGGYTCDNQFGLKEDYPTLVRTIISKFLSYEKVILHLVPHVVGSERGVENDYGVCYDIQQAFKSQRLILSPFFLDPCEAKGYISGLDFFMGARMHATIAAFSSGVPVVPMSYSRKFNGLYEDTLDYHYMVDLKQTSNEDALKTITSAFEQREQLEGIIQSRLDGVVREQKQHLYRDLGSFLQL